jgi:hypothetical protein
MAFFMTLSSLSPKIMWPQSSPTSEQQTKKELNKPSDVWDFTERKKPPLQ